MPTKQLLNSKKEIFQFTRVKDTYEENGQKFITLFGRLSSKNAAVMKSEWVEIEEVKWEQASYKLKCMPDAMYSYSVSEAIFRELVRLSRRCERELYYLTPIYKTSECKNLS